MKPTRLASALAAVALLVSSCGLTTHHAGTPAPYTARTVSVHALPADPSLGLLNDLRISLVG